MKNGSEVVGWRHPYDIFEWRGWPLDGDPSLPYRVLLDFGRIEMCLQNGQTITVRMKGKG